MENIINQVKQEIGWDLDEKLVAKEYKKITKRYKKLGKSEQEAHNKAIWFIDYYSHQFRKRVQL